MISFFCRHQFWIDSDMGWNIFTCSSFLVKFYCLQRKFIVLSSRRRRLCFPPHCVHLRRKVALTLNNDSNAVNRSASLRALQRILLLFWKLRLFSFCVALFSVKCMRQSWQMLNTVENSMPFSDYARFFSHFYSHGSGGGWWLFFKLLSPYEVIGPSRPPFYFVSSTQLFLRYNIYYNSE